MFLAAGRRHAHTRAHNDGHHEGGVLLEELPQPVVAHPETGMGYQGLRNTLNVSELNPKLSHTLRQP